MTNLCLRMMIIQMERKRMKGLGTYHPQTNPRCHLFPSGHLLLLNDAISKFLHVSRSRKLEGHAKQIWLSHFKILRSWSDWKGMSSRLGERVYNHIMWEQYKVTCRWWCITNAMAWLHHKLQQKVRDLLPIGVHGWFVNGCDTGLKIVFCQSPHEDTTLNPFHWSVILQSGQSSDLLFVQINGLWTLPS